jgi:hypothetical protein
MTTETDVITCKVCGHTDPLTKKLKCSKCGAKNWGNKLSGGSSLLSSFIIVVVIAIIFFVIDYVKKYKAENWSGSRIQETYINNIGLAYQSYVFMVTYKDEKEGKVFFVKNNDGTFSQWKENDTEPNYVFATCLLLNSTGQCVTSKNIGRPWENDLDNPALKREINNFNMAFNIHSASTISGFTIKLGFYRNGTENNSNSFVLCDYTGSYEDGKLAVLQPRQKTKTFDNVSSLLMSEYRTENKAGEKLFMFAFPQNDKDIINGEKLNAVLLPGELLASDHQTDTEGYINYIFSTTYTNEGSPVINTRGEVIAFNTMEKQTWLGVRTHFISTAK